MRGRTKIGKAALMLSMVLLSTLAFAVPPALSVGYVRAQELVDPTAVPGERRDLWLYASGAAGMWAYELTITYDTTVLTAMPPPATSFVRSTPTLMVVWFTDGVEGKEPVINDAAGTIRLGAHRTNGTGLATNDEIPIAYINFLADSEGFSVIHVAASVLLMADQTTPIAHTTKDGSFDNRIRATLLIEPLEVIDSDLVPPEATFPVEISVDDVRKMWGYEVRLEFDQDVLEVINLESLDPFNTVMSMDVGPGYAYIAAGTYFGDPNGITTTDPVPAVNVEFHVVGLGQTWIKYEFTELVDVYGNVLVHRAEWGFFDNTRIIADIGLPIIEPGSWEPCTEFDIPVYVDDVIKLWGAEFIIYYDDNVLTAVNVEPKDPFHTLKSEIGPGYVSLSVYTYFGDPDGVTTNTPIPVADVTFHIMAYGFSGLRFGWTDMVNVYGESIVHTKKDGRFANTYDLAVAVDTAFLETRRVSVANDALLTMTAQIKNVGSGWTKARARFTVLDSDGGFVTLLLSDEVSMSPAPLPIMKRLSVDLDAKAVPRPAGYTVEVEVQYLDAYGEWILAQKGNIPGGYKWMVVKTFTIED